MPSKVICVLGMHRSGTSCLCGTLEEAGVYLGEVSRKARYNVRGNRENRDIMLLHENILAANGGSWCDPPETVLWSAKHRRMQEEILRFYTGEPLWGFKDPRTLFTLDSWLTAIPHLTLVGIYRHPLAVAQSLQHRNQLTLEKGLNLWTRYNRKLLYYQAKFGFPIISFDLPEPDLRQELAWLLRYLKLPDAAQGLQFFDQKLRHQQSPTESSLPEAVNTLLEQLANLASTHEAPG